MTSTPPLWVFCKQGRDDLPCTNISLHGPEDNSTVSFRPCSFKASPCRHTQFTSPSIYWAFALHQVLFQGVRCDVQGRKPEQLCLWRCWCCFVIYFCQYLPSVYCVLRTLQGGLYAPTHFITHQSCEVDPVESRFTEEYETQRGLLPCVSSLGHLGIELGSKPRLPGSRSVFCSPSLRGKLNNFKRSDACSEKGAAGFSGSTQQGPCI